MIIEEDNNINQVIGAFFICMLIGFIEFGK
jgi:hypothetical protein